MSGRNARVQARYDQLMREGKHGHYETLFQIVNEECARMMTFDFPNGVRPALRELLNGKWQIVDDVEDAPLVTIELHNGTRIRP